MRSVQLGAFLEMLCAVTGIGTAVVLYPIVKRASSGRAVGFVASRTLEAAMIFVGILSVLSMITLRQDVAAGTDAATLTGSWHSLVAVHDWTFLMGPGFMPAFNALFLATVLYRTRLVPRIIPTIGLIGAPLLFLSSTVTMFGGWEQVSAHGLRPGSAHRSVGVLGRHVDAGEGLQLLADPRIPRRDPHRLRHRPCCRLNPPLQSLL